MTLADAPLQHAPPHDSSVPKYSAEEITRRGNAWFEQKVRAEVADLDPSWYLLIEVERGDWEAGPTRMELYERLEARHDNPAFFIRSVGRPSYLSRRGLMAFCDERWLFTPEDLKRQAEEPL